MHLGDIASAASVAALMAGAVIWFHETDNEPLEEAVAEFGVAAKTLTQIKPQVDAIEIESVVSRLTRIYEIKCSPEGTLSPDIQAKLNRLLVRYHSLTGVDFSEPC